MECKKHQHGWKRTLKMNLKREEAKQKLLHQRKNESRCHKQWPITGKVELMKVKKLKDDAAEQSEALVPFSPTTRRVGTRSWTAILLSLIHI